MDFWGRFGFEILFLFSWGRGEQGGSLGARGGERRAVLPKKCSQGSPVHQVLICHLLAAACGAGSVVSPPVCGEGTAL